MTFSTINRGSSAGDGTGEQLYAAFGKVNSNFAVAEALAHPGYVSGSWYPTWYGAAAAASNVMGANNITYFPFVPRSQVTISDVGVRVTIAGANLLIGIFASDATTKRATGTPLGYTANIDVSTTGVKTAALNANTTLDSGALYWFGFLTDTSAASCSCMGSLFNYTPFILGSATNTDILTA
jgi:hypothetical protein